MDQFQLDEKVVSAEPFGNGHINDTLKVTNEKGEIKYVLQRINHLIFNKGFTGSNGRKNRESTGMGLYICRELCKKLGMAVRAESVWGEYTRVVFEIPIAEQASVMSVHKV